MSLLLLLRPSTAAVAGPSQLDLSTAGRSLDYAALSSAGDSRVGGPSTDLGGAGVTRDASSGATGSE